MVNEASRGSAPVVGSSIPSAGRHWGRTFWQRAAPVVYGLIAGGVLLLVMGKNPIAFYWTTLESGLLTWSGLMQTIIRLAPLLLMSAGFIVAFQAGLYALWVECPRSAAACFSTGAAIWTRPSA